MLSSIGNDLLNKNNYDNLSIHFTIWQRPVQTRLIIK